MADPCVVAIVNPKGGVAKSTTARELAGQLSKAGKSVVIVDLDHSPGCLSSTMGADMSTVEGIAHALVAERYDFCDCVQDIEVRGAPVGLAAGGAAVGAAEQTLSDVANVGAQYRLRELLEGAPYDYVIVDTPGNLSVMTIMALNAATRVIIPVFAEEESVRGLQGVIDTADAIRRYSNPAVSVDGVLVCRYSTQAESPALLAEEIAELAREAGVGVYSTRIRQSHAKDGRRNLKFRDYEAFAAEFVGEVG